MSFSTAFWLCS